MSRARQIKVDTFSVPHSTRFSSDGFILRRAVVGSGRTAETTWAKQVTKEIDFEGSPEDVIASITEASAGLTDSGMEMEKYNYPYDDNDYHRIVLTGWTADVSDEDIAKALSAKKAEREERAAFDRSRAEQELARIRKAYPEMLNEG